MNARDATAARKRGAASACSGERRRRENRDRGIRAGLSGGRATASSAPSSISASMTPVETLGGGASADFWTRKTAFERREHPGARRRHALRARAPARRTPMRTGSAPASSAARIAMRSTMPRGRQGPARDPIDARRGICPQSGGRSSALDDGLEIVGARRAARPRRRRALARAERNFDEIAFSAEPFRAG